MRTCSIRRGDRFGNQLCYDLCRGPRHRPDGALRHCLQHPGRRNDCGRRARLPDDWPQSRIHFRHSAFEGRCCFRFPHDRKNCCSTTFKKFCGNRIFQAACDRLHAKLRDQSGKKWDVLDVATASRRRHGLPDRRPLAAAIGAGIDIHHPYGTMIVDMGGGTTDIAVITMGSIAISGSVRIAGNEFDEAIMRYVKKPIKKCDHWRADGRGNQKANRLCLYPGGRSGDDCQGQELYHRHAGEL